MTARGPAVGCADLELTDDRDLRTVVDLAPPMGARLGGLLDLASARVARS